MTASLLSRPGSRPREPRTRRMIVPEPRPVRAGRPARFTPRQSPSRHRPAPCTPEEQIVEELLMKLRGCVVRREPEAFDVLDPDENGVEGVLRSCRPDFEVLDTAQGTRVFLEVYSKRREDAEPNRRERRKQRRIDFIWRHYGVWVVWIDRQELEVIRRRPRRLEELIVEADRAQRRRKKQGGKLLEPRWGEAKAA